MSVADLIERVNAHLATDLHERNEHWYADSMMRFLDPIAEVPTATNVLRAWQDEIRRRWESTLHKARPSMNAEEKNEAAKSARDRLLEEVSKLPQGDVRGQVVQEIRSLAGDYANSLEAQVRDLLDEYSRPVESLAAPEPSTSSRGYPRVFISHSSNDAKTAELLTDLLRAALPLSANQIRCTSVTGHDFDGGTHTNATLRREVTEAGTVIGLVSAESVSSAWVLFELGARWGVDGPLIPCLAPGADVEQIPSPIRGRHALRCDRHDQLLKLVETVARHLELEKNEPSTYSRQIDALVQQAQQVTHTEFQEAPSSPRTPEASRPDDEYLIREHCEKRWPDDFAMQSHCVEQQKRARAELQRTGSPGVPTATFDQIVRRSKERHPDDFVMRAHWQNQQLEAYRKLQG